MRALPSHVDIVVIGAGITGLVLASRLRAAGKSVVVLERESQPGGLLASVRIGQVTVDRYYHHFFSRDIRLMTLLSDIGLSSQTSWYSTSTALLDNTGFHRLTTPLEILTYGGLSLIDKARLALLMKTARRTRFTSKMDDISAKSWAVSIAGKHVWERFLFPLVHAKFGRNCDEISAAWLAGRISCRSSRRWRGERLGYINKGFFQLPARMAEDLGKSLFLDHTATGIIMDRHEIKGIDSGGQSVRCSDIVFTGGVRALAEFLGERASAILPSLEDIGFQGILCGIFTVNKPPKGAYWTNVIAPGAPFNVVVQQNLLSRLSDSVSVIYVSKYLEPTNLPLSSPQTEHMLDEFQQGLRRFFDIRAEDIEDRTLVGTSDAGPVYSIGYRTRMARLKPRIKGLHIGGMLLSYPDRSVEQSVEQAEILSERILGLKRTGDSG